METKSKNTLVKNFIYNTAYQILVLVAPLITTPYVSRVLGATGIGIYSYAQSIATYFVLIGAVGTTLYGQREIAYTQKDPVKRSEVFWEIVVFRFVAVAICSVIYYLIFAVHGQYAEIYEILTLEVLATAFDISWFFMGMENFKLTVIRNTIIKLCGIIMVFAFVRTADDIQLYTWCLTLPVFIGNISLWFSLKKYLVKPKHSIIKGIPKHLKPIFILFLPQIASEVYLVLDKTMIGIFGTNIDQVGYYTQAQKIVKIVLMIVTSLGTVMLPAMSAAFAQGKKDQIITSIKTAFKFIYMISFALFFGLIGVAARFVPIFFGSGYDLVVPLISVIAPILMIIGTSNVIGKQFLLPTQQQGAYTISIVVGAAVNFILNIILIHFFDAVGASIATVLAELAVTLVQVFHVRHQLPLGECFKPILRYFLLGLVMFLAVWGTGKIIPDGVISLCIMVLVGMIVYVIELVVTKDPMLKLAFGMVKKKKK